MPTEVSTSLPAPSTIEPPHAPTAAPIHTKMLETVLHHRVRQLQRLSRHARHFERFLFHLVKALNRSRYQQSVDLLTGQYADYLLTHTKGMEGITLDKVACHFMALMYRCLDERLSSEIRLHAVGCVRIASGLLKEWLEKAESRKDFMQEAEEDERKDDAVESAAAQGGRKKKRLSGDASGVDDDESGQSKESSNKRARKRHLEMDTASDSLEKQSEMTNHQNVLRDNPRLSDGENVNHRQQHNSKDNMPGIEKKLQQQVTQGVMAKETVIETNNGHTSSPKTLSSPVSTQENNSTGDQTNSSNQLPQQSATEGNLSLHQSKRITPGENNSTDHLHNNSIGTVSNAENARSQDKATPPTQSTHQAMTVEKMTDDNLAKEVTSTTNHSVAEKGAAIPRAQTPASSQSAKQPIPEDSGVSVDKDNNADSINDKTITEMRHVFRKSRGAAVSDIEVADSTASVHATKKSSSRWSLPVTHNTTTPVSTKDVCNTTRDTPDGDRSNQTTDPIDASEPSGNVALTRAMSQSSDMSTSSDDSQTSSKSRKSDAGPVSCAKPTERSATSQSTSVMQPPVVGERNSIHSSSVSTFTSVNSKGTNVVASSHSTLKSGQSEALSATTAKVAVNNELQPTDDSHNSKETNSSNDARKSNAVDQDVIDLTTPPGSPRACLPSEESTSNLAAVQPPTPVIKQLPPSPPPLTKIIKPPPLPFPAPRPFAETHQVAFLADNKIPFASGSLYPRPANSFSYNSGFYLDGSGACLEHSTYIDVQERLSTWDPYWRIVGDLGTRKVKASDSGMTIVGTRTTACMSTRQNLTASSSSSVNSCAVLAINLSKAKEDSPSLFVGVKWGELATPDPSGSRIRDQYKTGDTRLILRTLPLYRTSKDTKKRADTHIWPQGTVVQLRCKRGVSLSDEFIVPIVQRRQEKHDEKSWKGMSHILDLTKYANPQQPLNIKLSSCEVVENAQNPASYVGGSQLSGSYAVYASICKYVGPDDLFDMLMGLKDGGDVLIPTLSERSAKIIAKEYVANQTVALVDSDDEDAGNKSSDESNSLTFSLLCPIQRTPMETPVRGRNCKHMQCFDLRNFLRINESVSGGRWRCGNCEDFLSIRDLIHCGLFQAMIDKYKGQISGIRDKVTLHSDGSFSLKDENKLRYANKKGGGASPEQSHATAAASEVVIDLD